MYILMFALSVIRSWMACEPKIDYLNCLRLFLCFWVSINDCNVIVSGANLNVVEPKVGVSALVHGCRDLLAWWSVKNR